MVQAILDPDYFVNALELCRDNLARLRSRPDLLRGLPDPPAPPAPTAAGPPAVEARRPGRPLPPAAAAGHTAH